MNKTIGFLAAVLVTLIGASFAYYLNRSTPDIRFTLSDRIPVSFLGPDEKQSANVQLLEIKNIGNAEARKIQIKIKGEIVSFKVEKFSASDSVQIFSQNHLFEVVYSELSPQAAFRLIFKSTGDGVTYDIVNISHSGGQAQQALSRKEQSPMDWLTIMWILVSALLALYYLRQILIAGRESQNKYKQLDKLTNSKKPWYLSHEKWKAHLKEALKYRIEQGDGYFVEIERSTSYSLLSLDKPPSLDDSDWSEILDRAIDSLANKFSTAIYRAWGDKELIELLTVAKPKNFPQNKWDELVDKASEHFLSEERKRFDFVPDILSELSSSKPSGVNEKHWSKHLESLQKKFMALKLDDYFFMSLKTIQSNLKETKPRQLQEDYWSKYIHKLRRTYEYELLIDMQDQTNAIDFLKEHDLSLLSAESKNSLEKKAYRKQLKGMPDLDYPTNAKVFLETPKPLWISTSDYEELLSRAKKTLGLTNKERELETKEKDIIAKSLENEKAASELSKREGEVSTLKDRIDAQLKIIHDLLNDSTSIDRIEEYNNVFASGNFDNLKKLAHALNRTKIE